MIDREAGNFFYLILKTMVCIKAGDDVGGDSVKEQFNIYRHIYLRPTTSPHNNNLNLNLNLNNVNDKPRHPEL